MSDEQPGRRSLADLKPNPRNPRHITKAKRDMLKDALARFGDLGGIVFNRRSGQLVGGHQRVVAFTSLTEGGVQIERQLPEPSVTGTVAEGFVDMAGERFSYREVDWDPETEMAANIAANKGAGDWNVPQLKDWLGELQAQDFALDLTMFDEDERAALHAGDDDGKDDEPEDDGTVDEVPEPPAEPTTRIGDVYALGAHRLMCGDSRDEECVATLIGSDKVSVVYTDPPYGISLQADRADRSTYAKRVSTGQSRNTRPEKDDLRWTKNYDRITGDDAQWCPAYLLKRFANAREVFVWGGDYFSKTLPDGGSWIVWDKRVTDDGTKEVHAGYQGSHFEICWSRQKHQRLVCRTLFSGYTGREAVDQRVHPSQKPVRLHEWFFRRWSRDDDIVADLYGGSGSTLLACQRTGRRCLMMELMPAYCDVIVARWENLTGEKSILIERDGQPVGNGVGMEHA